MSGDDPRGPIPHSVGMRTATTAVPRDVPSEDAGRVEPAAWVIAAALLYLGFDAAYPKFGYERGPLSVSLALGLVLALIGWRRPLQWTTVRPYLPWAVFLGFWMCVSGLAAWNGSVLYASLTIPVWLVFIVPGLGSLLRNRRNQHALLLGFAAGVAIFVGAAGLRLARGASVLDTDATSGVLLGLNRNAVNMRVLLLLPFLAMGIGPRVLRLARWPLVVLSCLWLVNSGGRSGLLGLAVAGIAYGLLQPQTSRRMRVTLTVLLIGTLSFTWIQTTGGEATKSTARLTDFLRGERDDSDEARELILRKAWHLAVENPFWGTGYGRFKSTYHPVVEEAPNAHVRRLAVSLDEHNTYAEFLGETGFVGLFAFIGLLSTLIISSLRRLDDRYLRTVTCSLATFAFVIFFHIALSVLLFYPIALLLSARDNADDTRGVSQRAGRSAP